MAEVNIPIGGRTYTVACRDGGEDRLRLLGQRVDAKVGEARAAVGNANEIRQLLFAALLLADEVDEATPMHDPDTMLVALAQRIEAVADALEGIADTA